jgi:hypothetical protein
MVRFSTIVTDQVLIPRINSNWGIYLRRLNTIYLILTTALTSPLVSLI